MSFRFDVEWRRRTVKIKKTTRFNHLFLYALIDERILDRDNFSRLEEGEVWWLGTLYLSGPKGEM